MNRENLRKARDLMASVPPEQFDMTKFLQQEGQFFSHLRDLYPDCGTVACLAGHIALSYQDTEDADNVEDFSRHWLGLTINEADDLFCNARTYGRGLLEEVTREDVIEKLDEMLESDS